MRSGRRAADDGTVATPMPRTRVRRLPEKAVDDRGTLLAILDAALVAHVGIAEAGQPYVVPMACARDGERLLLHGSSGSRLMRALAAGAPTCATITHLDGLVLARSAFESSMNYRCAMVFGATTPLTGDDLLIGLKVLTEHLLPGRWDTLRAPSRKELAATSIVALPLTEWSVKVSDGPPEDDPTDLDAAVWAGVLPLRLVAEEPVDAPDLRTSIPPRPAITPVLQRLRSATAPTRTR